MLNIPRPPAAPGRRWATDASRYRFHGASSASEFDRGLGHSRPGRHASPGSHGVGRTAEGAGPEAGPGDLRPRQPRSPGASSRSTRRSGRPRSGRRCSRRLGFKHFAYDWRAEHIPTFDAEIEALKRHGIALDAFWVAPGELNRESRIILDVLKRHGVKAQLWVLLDLGADKVTGAEQERRVAAAAAKLRPLAEEAAKIGCTLGALQPRRLVRRAGEPDRDHRAAEGAGRRRTSASSTTCTTATTTSTASPPCSQKMMPYLVALNLNGMDPGGDKVGPQDPAAGPGRARPRAARRSIRDSGYRGPIGILGHTQDDAEERLRDNLDGLDWLVPQLDGKPAGPPPKPRTPVPPRPARGRRGRSRQHPAPPTSRELARDVAALIDEARNGGDPRRGAEVFRRSPGSLASRATRSGPRAGSSGPT